jgi:hypothetical protein
MNQGERKKRPELSRRAPRRYFAQYNHPVGAEEPGVAHDFGRRTDGVEDAITKAVNLGYRVIDENLQHGRQAAKRIREGVYRSTDMENDIRAVVDRALRVTKEAASAWLDILSAPTWEAVLKGRANQGPWFSVMVQSRRQVHVTLDLHPASPKFVPVVFALRATELEQPAPIEVKFISSAGGERAVLAITVPDEVAPGTYTGFIVDTVTHQPGGTLYVRIPP